MLYNKSEMNLLRMLCIVLSIIIMTNGIIIFYLIRKKPVVILYDDFSGMSAVGTYSIQAENKSLTCFIFQYLALKYNFTPEIAKANLDQSFKYTTQDYKTKLLSYIKKTNY